MMGAGWAARVVGVNALVFIWEENDEAEFLEKRRLEVGMRLSW